MNPLELIKEHCNFATDFDVYVLLGVARKKDNAGITSSQEVVFREIIKGKDNIEKKCTKLVTQCKNYKNADDKGMNFYIYISVNGRDSRKGYMTFKNQMLKYEREILFGVDCHNQLKRVDSIWLSALMKPESRSTNNRKFMLDIDTKDERAVTAIVGGCLAKVHPFPILKQETKNGWHYVTTPFNVKEFNDLIEAETLQYICEVKTDALLFVEYINRGE